MSEKKNDATIQSLKYVSYFHKFIALWICESSVEILLAVNRCVEFGFPHATKRLFQGWRVWLWMMPPLIYGLYTLFFEKHAAFSAIYFAWFMDPHVGYFPTSQASTEVGKKL